MSNHLQKGALLTHAQWYLAFGNEAVGPFSTEVVIKLLQNQRLHFSDFICQSDQANWKKISEVKEFFDYQPEHPKILLSPSVESVPQIPAQPKPIPKAAPKPAPTKIEQAPAAVKEASSTAVSTDPVPATKENYRDQVALSQGKAIVVEYGEFETVNISDGGVFVKSGKEMVIGTELRFTLVHESFSKPLEMTGVVIRNGKSDGITGFAISFTRVNPAHRRQIRNHIETHQSVGANVRK